MATRWLRDGGYRTLIVCETVLLIVLIVILAAILVFAFAHNVFGVGWFSVGIALAATVAEAVRRFRHLRTDLQK